MLQTLLNKFVQSESEHASASRLNFLSEEPGSPSFQTCQEQEAHSLSPVTSSPSPQMKSTISDSASTRASSASDSNKGTPSSSGSSASTFGHKSDKLPVFEPYTIRYLSDSQMSRTLHIGEQVMPSTHKGQKVCFAQYTPSWTPGNEVPPRGSSSSSGKKASSSDDKNNADVDSVGMKVVVKVRERKVSFKDATDIAQWKSAMSKLMVWQRHFQSGYIVQLIDILEDATSFYAIMQLVNGIDLFEFMHRLRIVDETARGIFIVKVAYQLCAALKDFSSPGELGKGNPLLVHKDLKLENVVLDDDRGGSRAELRVIDFDTVEEAGVLVNGQWQQTMSTDIMGTDQYIAPEAYCGVYSASSDLFAVGVMLYKLCVGSFPFADEIFDDEPGQNYMGHPKMQQIALKLRTAKIDFHSDPFWSSTDIGVKAKDFVARCLAYDPVKRLNIDQALKHPLILEYDDRHKTRRWVDFKRVKDPSRH